MRPLTRWFWSSASVVKSVLEESPYPGMSGPVVRRERVTRREKGGRRALSGPNVHLQVNVPFRRDAYHVLFGDKYCVGQVLGVGCEIRSSEQAECSNNNNEGE